MQASLSIENGFFNRLRKTYPTGKVIEPKVLRCRASVRKYNDRMPDEKTIQKVVDAALLSPIVRWHNFHLSVITNKEAIQLAEDTANEYAKTKSPKKFMYGAPVWIILSGKRHTDENPATEKMKTIIFSGM